MFWNFETFDKKLQDIISTKAFGVSAYVNKILVWKYVCFVLENFSNTLK